MKNDPNNTILAGDNIDSSSVSGIQRGIVDLPVGGITIGKGQSYDLTALFDKQFVRVGEVTIVLKFSGNLFEIGDSWIIDSFGGVRRDGGGPLAESRRRSTDLVQMMRFCTGRFKFNIRAGSGSIHIAEILFLLSGVPVKGT